VGIARVSALLALAWFLIPETAVAQEQLLQGIENATSGETEEGVGQAVRLIMMLTALSVVPAVLLLMTPFTRFVIVFSLMRQALGLQQSPPNQVLIGLSLALSLVVMQPTVTEVNTLAVQPYMAGEMTTTDALSIGMAPMRKFMLANVQRDDLASSLRISRIERPTSIDEIPSSVVVTSFVLSELRAAFSIAVKVYIPFLVIDIIVASVLLGMGMMMLPPVVISLPFKLLIFVLMDGWTLLVTGLAGGYT
jgi:flagellar biosynthetic protein FliP